MSLPDETEGVISWWEEYTIVRYRRCWFRMKRTEETQWKRCTARGTLAEANAFCVTLHLLRQSRRVQWLQFEGSSVASAYVQTTTKP